MAFTYSQFRTVLLPADLQRNYLFDLRDRIAVHERLFFDTTSGAEDLRGLVSSSSDFVASSTVAFKFLFLA